jgi:S-DNA-T family DNA segregation ATPase FtsK/SpoIIIE
VVTTYEFKPDAGVKYSKITGLADDLCLAMQAESVLIDRIPGKSTVGIQIPNPNREQISMRELLESDAYRRSQSKLTLAMGKTIHGEPFVADLATMPHLLIAGSTGTGKSVSVNAMLSSILFRATPDDVRLIMVDPKRLELGMYEDIPHLLTPVVVDPKQAANALRWAVREMEERYKTLAAVGVRNIEQYNRNLKLAQGENNGPVLDDNGIEVKPLPFIIVLIDELADLMMIAGNEVEESIARLAQMARAVGIHLILATQRPSVDVITGVIKANFPSRIAFQVASKIDSRTVLDMNGAENLLGHGDMLFTPAGKPEPYRIHGAYVSEEETARVVDFWRAKAAPGMAPPLATDAAIVEAEEDEDGAGEDDFDDALINEAARLVVTHQQGSTSLLQRRLKVGYSRAGRLMDQLESLGVVGPFQGSKARDVLVDERWLAERGLD